MFAPPWCFAWSSSWVSSLLPPPSLWYVVSTCVIISWIFYLVSCIMVPQLCSLRKKREKHLINHYNFHFLGGYLCLKSFSFIWKKPAHLSSTISLALSLMSLSTFFYPPWKNLSPTLGVRIAFCHSIMALTMQVLIKYWSSLHVSVTLFFLFQVKFWQYKTMV